MVFKDYFQGTIFGFAQYVVDLWINMDDEMNKIYLYNIIKLIILFLVNLNIENSGIVTATKCNLWKHFYMLQRVKFGFISKCNWIAIYYLIWFIILILDLASMIYL